MITYWSDTERQRKTQWGLNRYPSRTVCFCRRSYFSEVCHGFLLVFTDLSDKIISSKISWINPNEELRLFHLSGGPYFMQMQKCQQNISRCFGIPECPAWHLPLVEGIKPEDLPAKLISSWPEREEGGSWRHKPLPCTWGIKKGVPLQACIIRLFMSAQMRSVLVKKWFTPE